MRKSVLSFPLVLLWAAFPRTLPAADFYLDPVNGGPAGDGSRERPFGSLQQVIESGLVQGYQCSTLPYQEGCSMTLRNPAGPIKGGDRLRLLSGYHGEITIQDAFEDVPIVVEAEPGHSAKIKSLRCLGASNWVFRNLSISPEHVEPYAAPADLVNLENHNFRGPCRQVTIEGCTLFSQWDSSAWSLADWNNLPANGISVSGDDNLVLRNYLRNVDFGISVSGRRVRVIGNVIENFAGDGLRGLGDEGLFEGNTVMNCYDVNENHDDGFQSWSTGPGGVGTGEVRGVVLRANTIINYTDPNQPFRGTLQGIGCFDGFYVDWVVENNVIITDHWHGITFLGARNVRIVNNTVVDSNQQSPGPPWIEISAHKDGTASENCLIRNNLATDINTAAGVSADHNLQIDSAWAERYFADYAGRDLRLVSDSPAIDQGTEELTPATDHDGVPRPQGAGIDIGAFEWTEPGRPDAGEPDGADGGGEEGGGADGADAPPADDAGPGDETAPAVDGDAAADAGADPSDGASGPEDGQAADGAGRMVGYGCACGAAPGAASAGALTLFLLLRRRRP